MKVQVLVDDPASWFVPYARELVRELVGLGHEATLLHAHAAVSSGEVLCLLSCTRIFRHLSVCAHNVVVHASALPQGKGWSPMAWQIQEGAAVIPLTLFEASEGVDDGPVYLRSVVRFAGHELLDELRAGLARGVCALVLRYVDEYEYVEPIPQVGEETHYRRRTDEDNRLDPAESIAQQFDRLRVCDNERYPAHFELRGHRYELRIRKARP